MSSADAGRLPERPAHIHSVMIVAGHSHGFVAAEPEICEQRQGTQVQRRDRPHHIHHRHFLWTQPDVYD